MRLSASFLCVRLDALKRGRWLWKRWSTRNHVHEVVKAYEGMQPIMISKKTKGYSGSATQLLRSYLFRVLGLKYCREEEIDPEDVITDRLEPLVLYESQAHSSDSSESRSLPTNSVKLCGPQCPTWEVQQLEPLEPSPGHGSSTLLEAWLGSKAWLGQTATWRRAQVLVSRRTVTWGVLHVHMSLVYSGKEKKRNHLAPCRDGRSVKVDLRTQKNANKKDHDYHVPVAFSIFLSTLRRVESSVCQQP